MFKHLQILFIITVLVSTTVWGQKTRDPFDQSNPTAPAQDQVPERSEPQDRAYIGDTKPGRKPNTGRKSAKNTKTIVSPPSTLTWPDGAGRFAIIIGVNDYQSEQINDLKAAVNDARLLAKTLAQNAGFEPDHIKLLTTDQGSEGQPTQGTILEKTSNFVSGMPRQGLLLFFFAGHGVVNEGKAYLLPSDARMGSAALLKKTAISLEDIRNEVNQAGIEQVMFILDACRNDPSAGARGNVDNLLSDDFSRGLDFRDAAFFDNKNRGIKAFVTLYATGKGQRAYEDSAKAQGYFTLAIAEALTGQGNNITNQKGEVTLGNLLSYVQHKVAERVKLDTGKDQVPFYDVSEG
ncbi:MAG TPA: caspase family protein, partial [Acidobacteriota bacterium]|nr:caspase family protein [Acidobacteriota bacterium]